MSISVTPIEIGVDEETGSVIRTFRPELKKEQKDLFPRCARIARRHGLEGTAEALESYAEKLQLTSAWNGESVSEPLTATERKGVEALQALLLTINSSLAMFAGVLCVDLPDMLGTAASVDSLLKVGTEEKGDTEES